MRKPGTQLQTAVLRWPRCHLFLELPGVQPHRNVRLELGPHVLRRLGRLVQPENRCWGQMWNLQQEGVGMLRRRKGRRRRERVTSAQLPLEPRSPKPPARGSQVCEQLHKPLVQSVKRWGGMSGSDVLDSVKSSPCWVMPRIMTPMDACPASTPRLQSLNIISLQEQNIIIAEQWVNGARGLLKPYFRGLSAPVRRH